jgi:hypothetical protein
MEGPREKELKRAGAAVIVAALGQIRKSFSLAI